MAKRARTLTLACLDSTIEPESRPNSDRMHSRSCRNLFYWLFPPCRKRYLVVHIPSCPGIPKCISFRERAVDECDAYAPSGPIGLSPFENRKRWSSKAAHSTTLEFEGCTRLTLLRAFPLPCYYQPYSVRFSLCVLSP